VVLEDAVAAVWVRRFGFGAQALRELPMTVLELLRGEILGKKINDLRPQICGA
jgi:hypothetical protein